MTLNSLINNILFEEDTPNSFIDSIISRVLSKQINEPAFEGNIGDNGNFQNFINTRISLIYGLLKFFYYNLIRGSILRIISIPKLCDFLDAFNTEVLV